MWQPPLPVKQQKQRGRKPERQTSRKKRLNRSKKSYTEMSLKQMSASCRCTRDSGQILNAFPWMALTPVWWVYYLVLICMSLKLFSHILNNVQSIRSRNCPESQSSRCSPAGNNDRNSVQQKMQSFVLFHRGEAVVWQKHHKHGHLIAGNPLDNEMLSLHMGSIGHNTDFVAESWQGEVYLMSTPFASSHTVLLSDV